MSKRGVSFKLNVSLIEKARLYKGEKGSYLNVTGFIDDTPDQYGNNGFLTQDCTKEEREAGLKMPILGNSKIFWSDDNQGQAAQAKKNGYEAIPNQVDRTGNVDDFDDDIPF